jgi:hypothetical protein
MLLSTLLMPFSMVGLKSYDRANASIARQDYKTTEKDRLAPTDGMGYARSDRCPAGK